MDNADFEKLKAQVAIAPQSAEWPRPDFSKVSISTGDKPHYEVGDPHWGAMHDAVHEARDCTVKTLGAIAAVEADKTLSATGKAAKKKEIASKALAALEKSPRLEKARKSVASQVERWNEKLGLSPTAPSDAGAVMLHAEIRARIAGMKPAERLLFINSHVSECGDAILSAPAFLSGLTPAELGIVKTRVEASANPELAKAKAETVAALADLERGWRAAFSQIRSCGGLEKSFDGMAEK